jgi:CheY-like chemotaxis protein
MSERARKKIVFLDDVYHTLLTFQHRIRKHYELYPVQTVVKLFEILENVKVDLILLDVCMPDECGFKVLERIKQEDRYADIPVIFLTSQRDKYSVMTGLKMGAVDFIYKPTASESIMVECINFHLEEEKKSVVKQLINIVNENPNIIRIDDDPGVVQTIIELLKEQCIVHTVTKQNNKTTIKVMEILDAVLPGIGDMNLIGKKDKPDEELLLQLKKACEEYSMDGIISIMDELNRYEYESDDGLVDWLCDKVKAMELMQIVARLS